MRPILRPFFLLLFIFPLYLSVTAQTNCSLEFSHFTAKKFDELKTKMDSLLNKYNIPGAAFAIVSSDSIIQIGSVGYANIELKTPIEKNTQFRTGSITKSFVALGILKLVEEGRLNLQTPVKKILPHLDIYNPWEDTDPLLVVHLLEHTSGLNDPHFNDYYLDSDPDIPLIEGVKVSDHYLKLRWRPGQYRSYSSAGYMIAGIILEKITGQKFEEYLKRIILEPLGMTSSSFNLTMENRQLLAQGYKAHHQPDQYWYSYSRPAGSFNSSASELAKFIQFMLKRGKAGETQIFAASSIQRMEKSVTDPAAKAGLESKAGLGLGSGYYKGFKWYGHHGAIMGFSAAYGYCRDLNIGCLLLTNYWDVDFRTGMIKLWDTLRDYATGDAESPRKTSSMPDISLALLEEYSGYYKWCNPPQQLSAWIDLILNYTSIKIENDSLFYKDDLLGSWIHLIPVTERTFREKDELSASKVLIKTSDNERAMINGGSYYLQTSWLQVWSHVIFFVLSWMIMLSSIFYAIVWIPLEIYKRISQKKKRSAYLHIRVLPLVAIIIILFSFTLVGMQVNQSVVYIGQKTVINVFFYLSTWIFAILSFLSLFFSIRSFKRPVKPLTRIYALILSLFCVGMTLYWGYWGLIGLKLWSY